MRNHLLLFWPLLHSIFQRYSPKFVPQLDTSWTRTRPHKFARRPPGRRVGHTALQTIVSSRLPELGAIVPAVSSCNANACSPWIGGSERNRDVTPIDVLLFRPITWRRTSKRRWLTVTSEISGYRKLRRDNGTLFSPTRFGTRRKAGAIYRSDLSQLHQKLLWHCLQLWDGEWSFSSCSKQREQEWCGRW